MDTSLHTLSGQRTSAMARVSEMRLPCPCSRPAQSWREQAFGAGGVPVTGLGNRLGANPIASSFVSALRAKSQDVDAAAFVFYRIGIACSGNDQPAFF